MAINLMEMLQNQLGGEVMKQASSFLGESPENTTAAMGAAIPSILGSVINQGSTESGAAGILDMITGGGFDGSMLSNIGSMFSGGDATSGLMETGTGLLGSLFGDKLSGIVGTIASLSGISKGSSNSLLSMAAPLVMSMIGKQVIGNGLNASGLMNFLGSQKSFVEDAMPSGIGSLLGAMPNMNMGAVSDAGKKVMETAGTAVTETASAGGGFLKKILPIGLLAILALGALWFFRGSSNVDAVTGAAGDMMEATKDAAGNAMDATKDVAGAAVEATKDAAGNVVDAAGNVVEGATDAVAGAADAAMDAAGGLAAGAIEAGKKALEGVTFAAGSVGEKFSNFLAGGGATDEAFAFNNLNFATGSTQIDQGSMAEIQNLAKVLMAYPAINVEIAGHTDNTGNATSNMSLSQGRAEAVAKALAGMGVNAKRITAKGYGDTKPVASNDTAEGRTQNRRIDVRIVR